MVALLSEQQRQGLQAEPEGLLAVLDEQTQRRYYLVPAEKVDRLWPLLADGEFDPRETYPLIAKTAAAAGWADPLMDEYDHYDEAHAKH